MRPVIFTALLNEVRASLLWIYSSLATLGDRVVPLVCSCVSISLDCFKNVIFNIGPVVCYLSSNKMSIFIVWFVRLFSLFKWMVLLK